MEEQKYIGPNKIIGIVPEEGKTPMGSDIVKVMFDGAQQPIIMSKTAFDLLATHDPIDDTTFQERKFAILVPKIRELAIEYFILGYELTALMNKTGTSLSDDYDRAANFLWTGEDKRWVPGMAFSNFFSVLEADQIIKKIPPKDEPTGDTEKNHEPGTTTPKGN